jgi:hypothetical protein
MTMNSEMRRKRDMRIEAIVDWILERHDHGSLGKPRVAAAMHSLVHQVWEHGYEIGEFVGQLKEEKNETR